jgi:hypothetical protein
MTAPAMRGGRSWPRWGIRMLVILGVCLAANLLLLMALAWTWAVGASARSCTVIRYSFPRAGPVRLGAASQRPFSPDMVLQAKGRWPQDQAL